VQPGLQTFFFAQHGFVQPGEQVPDEEVAPQELSAADDRTRRDTTDNFLITFFIDYFIWLNGEN